MQKARRQLYRTEVPYAPPTACKQMVSGAFHSPLGVLFTFPSRYWFTIGRQRVFSLGRWSSRIPARFLVSRGTWVTNPKSLLIFAYRTITFFGHPFLKCSANQQVCNSSTLLQKNPTYPRNPDDTTPAGFDMSSV